MTALIEMELTPSTAYQLMRAANPTYVGETTRKTVTDVLDVTTKFRHIIVNPKSDPKFPWEVAGSFDGKQAIYAAFKFILDEFSIFSPGRHECNIDLRIPRTLRPVAYKTDQNGRWHCFRVQNDGLVEIKFRDKADPDPYILWLRDNYQNLHDAIDAMMKGAYCDIDLSGAPKLYEYFLSLMTMTPEEARETINTHENMAIAKNYAWQRSKDVEPADSFVVNGTEMPAEEVEKLIVVANNDDKGFSFNVNGKNTAYLTELVEEGYVLSSL